jgi:glutathione S-transferase
MTASDPLTLYTEDLWDSPYVFTAFVALTEKATPFETVILALDKKEQQRPEYRDRSLTAKVPTLVDGDFWLSESTAIVEYLEGRFPPPAHPRLLPADLHQRARARQVMSWLRTDLVALRKERPTTSMFYPCALPPLTQAAEAAVEKLLRVTDSLIPAGETSLFGAWSIADSDLAFMLHRLIQNGRQFPAKVQAFAAAQWQRPSVRAFVEHSRPAGPP